MLGVVQIPYMDTQVDRLMREVPREMGRAETYNKAPVGVSSARPASRPTTPISAAKVPGAAGASAAATA